MSTRSTRPRNLFGRFRNSTGLLMALAFALIGAGVVLFVFISQRSGSSGVSTEAKGGVAAKIGDLPANIGEATDIAAVGSTKDARFQVADKNDPTRVAIELLFSQMNPVGNAVYEANEPRAWVYMKDGRTIYIRADQARVKRIGAAAPESGEFRGNGVALVFPPRTGAEAGRAIDPDQDAPGLISHFQAASFDTVLLELSSQDPFTVETEATWLAGVGFVVRANQVQERLEFAKINSGGQIRYRIKDSSDQQSTIVAEDAADFVGPPSPIASAVANDDAVTADVHPSTVASEGVATDPNLIGPPAPPRVTAAAHPVKQDLYLAEFRDTVQVVQTGRTLAADLLSVWLRVVDNKLPDNALGEPPNARERAAGSSNEPLNTAHSGIPLPLAAQVAAMALAQSSPAGPGNALQQAPATRALFKKRETDVILTWSGGMVARPLSNDRPPAELADGNHVHARFTADRPGGQSRVVLTDRETGAAGVCSALDYSATTRVLSLSRGANVDRVDFTIPGSGRFIVPSVSINLVNGRGRVIGDGLLVQLPGEDPNLVTVPPQFPPMADPDAALPESVGRRIAWSALADFKFRSHNREMTDALESAAFDGDVVARDRGSWLSGDQLTARFRQTKYKKSALARVQIDGEALAIGRSTKNPPADFVGPARDAFVTAESLDVRFEPGTLDPRDDEPTLAIARGQALVSDARGVIEARRLESKLITKPRGSSGGSTVEAGDVLATGEVIAELFPKGGDNDGSGSIVVRADQLKADAQQRWAELTANDGGEVTLARGASIIAGSQMRLDEPQGRLEVFGAGSLRHVQLANTATESAITIPRSVLDSSDESVLPPGITLVRATWTRSMSFADRAGRIECHGDATVTSTTLEGGQLSRSERLLLDITPAEEARKAENAAAAGLGNSGALTLAASTGSERFDGRKLLRAESIGAAMEREGGAPASVKSWKFAPLPLDFDHSLPPAPRTYEQVLYLEGPTIVVDEIAGTMTVPDAGRGVTFDQSPRSSATPTTALGGGSSGRSQFTWTGSLDFNRITGALRMNREVELRHLPLDSTELVRMVCDRLDASFNTRGGRGAELLTADAIGGVFAESGSRHLTSDLFSFDATTGAAIARSNSESPVTMQDDRTASPMLAKSLRWDTRTDRIEITEPMPVMGGMSR